MEPLNYLYVPTDATNETAATIIADFVVKTYEEQAPEFNRVFNNDTLETNDVTDAWLIWGYLKITSNQKRLESITAEALAKYATSQFIDQEDTLNYSLEWDENDDTSVKAAKLKKFAEDVYKGEVSHYRQLANQRQMTPSLCHRAWYTWFTHQYAGTHRDDILAGLAEAVASYATIREFTPYDVG